MNYVMLTDTEAKEIASRCGRFYDGSATIILNTGAEIIPDEIGGFAKLSYKKPSGRDILSLPLRVFTRSRATMIINSFPFEM